MQGDPVGQLQHIYGQVLMVVFVLCGTAGGVATALSFIFGVLGNYWPKPFLQWAMRASDFGARVHGWGNKVGSLLPGGQPPQLAMLKSLAPRPSMVDMCPACGTPTMLPAKEIQ